MITPSRRLDFTEIPVLDIGPLLTGENEQECIEALRAACSEVGFFYIQNHQVSPSLISDVKSAADEFFCAPTDEKMALAISPQIQGYLPLGYRSYEGQKGRGPATRRDSGLVTSDRRRPSIRWMGRINGQSSVPH